MRAFQIFRMRSRALLRRSEAEADLQRELDLHREQLRREAAAEGLPPAAAARAASLRFGSEAAAAEACRDARGVTWVNDFFRDIRLALRGMRRSPAFAVTAVLSLALGVGANAVVFGVFSALLLKPLPIAGADRVFFVNNGATQTSISFPAYREVRDRNAVFSSLFAYRLAPMALDQGGVSDREFGLLVTGNYWSALGLKPAAGRFFTPEEDQHPNASPYAVLSYQFWQSRFGGDPGVVGSTVRINGMAYTVTGIAPAGFHGTDTFYWSSIFLPMMMQPQIEGRSWLDNPNDFDAWMGGRLKPGVTVAAAEANLATIATQLARENKANEGLRFTLSPMGLAGALLRGPVRAFGTGVLLLALLVLLAACANLAALLSARALDRRQEMAVRLSLGAGRSRLVRQLLTEALVLAALGGAGGSLLAIGLLGALSHWRAPLDFPIHLDVNPDWRVFAFAWGITLVTAALCGAAPVRQAWKTSFAGGLKGGRALRLGRWTGRDLLLPLQLALCALLVSASLVAARGLTQALRAPLGMQPDGAAVIGYDLNLSGYSQAAAPALQQRLLDRVRGIPGVESAAFANSIPLSIDQSSTSVYREGTTDFRPRTSIRSVAYYEIGPGYLHVLGTRLLAGRGFTDHDDAAAPRVAVVNRRLAVLLTGSADAVGKRFLRGSHTEVEIVGVVEDGKYSTLTEAPRPAVFWPMAQEYNSTRVLIARSTRPPSDLALAMRDAAHDAAPRLAVYGVGSVRQQLGLVYLPMRAAVVALGAFGLLALMLSFTGIYGMAAYIVSRRVRDIAVRMALGARRAQVLRFLFARIGWLVACGAALGLAGGIAAAGILAGIVYGASPRDPELILGSVAAIALVALAAMAGPARRAIGTDPIRSLRQE